LKLRKGAEEALVYNVKTLTLIERPRLRRDFCSKIKRKKNTNFENFEEIQDHSSSNTARIFKSYTIQEEESLEGKDRNYSKEEITYILYMLWKTCRNF